MDLPSERKSLRGLLAEMSAKPQVFPDFPCALAVREPCCRGLGYVVRPVGPLARAELCACVRNCRNCLGLAQRVVQGLARPCRSPAPRRVVNLFNQAMIPSRYAGAHMGEFKNYTGNCSFILNEVKHWLRDFDTQREKKGLIISGPVGIGKTYMITALARRLAEKNVSVRFVDFFQLISQIKAAYAESRSDQDILRPLNAVEVLVVDELGKGRNTEFEATVLDQLVMNRYNENKILVATTNLSIKARASDPTESGSFNYLGSLESRVGKRIFSRLFETTKFVEMKGEDFRRQALKP